MNVELPAVPAPSPAALWALSVEPVRTEADRDAFLELQLSLMEHEPLYVPPIIAERRDFLDSRKNPFLQRAQLELFLARRGGKVVGRIAAINDPLYNQFHNAEVGFFGMFDAENDPLVAEALLDAAGEWVRRRGLKRLMGPVNLSFNHDAGLLVEGFEHPPAMMMPYNPPYYERLLTGCRFVKAKDLFAYELSTFVAAPESIVRAAEQMRKEAQVRVRALDPQAIPAEIRRIKSVYNAMLERSWGFVPMSNEEFDAIAARLRPLVHVRPELCLFAEVNGEPVAFSLTLPDSNIALKAAGGRLTRFGLPVGLARMLWAARGIDRLRVLLLGVKPAFRSLGLETLLYLDTMRAARELGYTGGELGWAAEDNEPLNRAIEGMGARRYKTYRVYERPIGGG